MIPILVPRIQKKTQKNNTQSIRNSHSSLMIQNDPKMIGTKTSQMIQKIILCTLFATRNSHRSLAFAIVWGRVTSSVTGDRSTVEVVTRGPGPW